MPQTLTDRQHGQVLALFTFGFLAITAMVALVVDGGNAFVNHRWSQNATDAAAEAGAVVLAERLGGAVRSDTDVRAAVDGLLGAMDMDVSVSHAGYTDIDGNLIGVTVGSIGSSDPPSDAWGVAVTGERTFDTYFARGFGIEQLAATTEATAITGYGHPVGATLLPITPPINIVTCDGQNDPVLSEPPQHWGTNVVYRIPLCKNGPGNVGWIDWSPTAGGTSELIDEILNPSGPPIVIPSWNYVTETGNVNSKGVEDALRTYDGDVVLIPIFDSTCDTEPSGPDVEDCPAGNVGGNGQNQWYHFPEVSALQLCDASIAACPLPHGAYVNGNNSAQCDTGNGATSCLVGRFVHFITEGTVTGPPASVPGPSDFIVVQLIR